MKENKKFRKDDLSSVDSSKRVYRMYKKKKNWVVAPVLFALLAPTMIAGPGAVIANAVENPATETTVDSELQAKRAEYLEQLSGFEADFVAVENNNSKVIAFRNSLQNKDNSTGTIEKLNKVMFDVYAYYYNNIQFESVKKGYATLLADKYSQIEGTIAYTELQNAINLAKEEIGKVDFPAYPTGDDLTAEDIDKATADAYKAVLEFGKNIQRDYVAEIDKKEDAAKEVMDYVNNFAAKKAEAISQLNNWKAEIAQLNVDGKYYSFAAEAEEAVAKVGNLELNENKDNVKAVMATIDFNTNYINLITQYVKASDKAQNYMDELDDADLEDSQLYNTIKDHKDQLSTIQYAAKEHKITMENTGSTDNLNTAADYFSNVIDNQMNTAVDYLMGDQIKADVQNAIDNKDKLEFVEKVEKLRKQISDYVKDPDLSDDLKAAVRKDAKDMQARIDKATTVAQIDALQDEWDGIQAYYQVLENDKENTLEKTKEEAVKVVEKYSFTEGGFLPDERAGYFIHLIEDFAETKEAVASYLQQAHSEAVKAESDVKDARKAAKKAVKDLKLKDTTLPDESEQNYLDKIDAARSIADINDLVEDAEFTKDKEVAFQTLKELGLIPSSAMYQAKDKDELKEAYNIILEHDGYTKVQQASSPDKARGWAYRLLDAMTYLNEGQKETFRADLKSADNQHNVVEVFRSIANTNKAMREHAQIADDLQDAKDKAIDAINGLKYIDRSMKDAFISEVNAAKTEDDINKGDSSILERAKAENARAKDLFDAKKDAIKAINKLPQLTYKEKTNFGERVANASSKEAVESIQREAIVLSEGRQIDKASEDKARTIAQDAVRAYETAGDLNKEQAKGFIKRLEDAKSVKEIKAIYDEVVKTADAAADKKVIPTINKHIKASQFASAQKAVDQLCDKDTRAKYQAKLDEAIKVAVAQADAHKVIDSLTTLTDKEKDQAKKDVDKLDKVKEIKDLIEKLLVKEDKVLAKAIEALIKAEDYEAAQAKIAELRSQTEKDRLTAMLEEAMNTAPRLQYQAHVRNKGWMKVGNIKPTDEKATTIGTTGEALPMEAIVVSLNDVNLKKNGIQYRAHVRNLGWQEWTNSGYAAGTTGKALSIENLQFKLTGEVAKKYDIKYRAHVRNLGWQEWVKNGAKSGTTGKGLPIEALQIKLVKKDVAK